MEGENTIFNTVGYREFPLCLQKTILGRKFLYILPSVIDQIRIMNLLI